MESGHKQAPITKEVKNNSSRSGQLKKQLMFVGLTASVVVLIVSVLHLSLLRVYADPWGDYHDDKRLQSATSSIERAEAGVEIVERLTKDFEAIQSSSILKSKSTDLVAKIVEYDHYISTEMDQARKEGVDILVLVTRYCDALEEQHRVLTELYNTNSALTRQVAQMHESAHHIEEALNEVESGLNEAMHWR